MTDPLNTIDPEHVEKSVNDSYKTIHKCTRQFADIPACQQSAQEVKRWIEEFKPFIPLIQALRNPGMRQRHWEQVPFHFRTISIILIDVCLLLADIDQILDVLSYLY